MPGFIRAHALYCSDCHLNVIQSMTEMGLGSYVRCMAAQDILEEIAAAEDANKQVEEENEALRAQLQRVQKGQVFTRMHSLNACLVVQEILEEVAAAEDANKAVEEENEALRQQLARVQEQLQAIQAESSSVASPQVSHHPPSFLLLQHCTDRASYLHKTSSDCMLTFTYLCACQDREFSEPEPSAVGIDLV